jgi:hypothetical protein
MAKTPFLDTEFKDLIVENGNLKFTSNDGEYISQKIENLLLFFQGEWWLNEDLGLPYYESILVKNPDFNLISTIFKEEILTIEEVETIEKFEVDYDNSLRKLTIFFAVKTTSGDTIEGSV